MKRIIFSVLAIVLITNSCNSDDQTNNAIDTSESIILNDVSYGADPYQIYDIYLPKDRTLNTKVIILIHGGGWKAGDKSDIKGFMDFIRQELPDIAVINMNYRLADQNNPPLPMQIDDISTVIANLKNNQNKYQIGTDIGFMGISAGAHLSLLWSYEFDLDSQVKLVCSMVGPTNLADEAFQNSQNQEIKDLIAQFGSDIEILKDVSPLFKVKPTSPATLLFYGAQDPLIPNSQGIDLKNRLEELEVPHEFTLYPNGGHGWIGPDLLDTSIKLKAFIQTHL